MSKEVKRWSHHTTWQGSQIAATMMALRDDGQFVSWDDYEALLAERDAAQKDAERYRWLRRNIGVQRTNNGAGPVSPYLLIQPPARDPIAEETDAAIDAALQGEQK